MGFFWFIIAMVFLALWLDSRSTAKRKSGDRGDYNRGYQAGFDRLWYMVNDAVDGDQVDIAKIRAALAGATTVRSQAAPEVDSQPTLPSEVVSPEVARERRAVKNLNILLYAGSFLIVAAMALFVTLTMAAGVKLAGIIVVTASFYIAGLAIYRRSVRLRPAAIAFIGTGMAILPFIGFALNSLGGLSPEVAWLVTSIVGVVAYVAVARQLQSRVVSYLTIAFVVSLALSAVSTLDVAVVWSFLSVIGVALILSSLHYLAPGRVPEYFRQPVEHTSLILTPLSLLFSVFVLPDVDQFFYQILFSVATAYYLVIWLEHRHLGYEIAVRVLGHLAVLSFLVDSSVGDLTRVAIWSGMILLQIIYSLVRVRLTDRSSGIAERSMLVAGLFMLIVTAPFWYSVEYGGEWWVVVLLTLGAVLGGVVAYRFRQVAWLYASLLATWGLPFAVGYGILGGDWSEKLIVSSFIGLCVVSITTLYLLHHLQKLSKNGNILAVLAAISYLLIALPVASAIGGGWLVLTLAALTIVFYLFAYSQRAAATFVILAGLALLGLATTTWDWLKLDPYWQFAGVMALASAVYYSNYWLAELRQSARLQKVSLVMTLAALGILAAVYLLVSDDKFQFVGPLAVLASAGVVAVHGWRHGSTKLVEASIYIATLGLQRLVAIYWPETPLVVYGHWWAAVIVAVAWWRKSTTDRRYVVALAMATLSSMIMALDEGGVYATLFLVEHALLLIVGVLLKRSWVVWWGIVATVLAVLYFIRGYTTLVLLLLGALLIGFVIWRLTRADKKPSTDGITDLPSVEPKPDKPSGQAELPSAGLAENDRDGFEQNPHV